MILSIGEILYDIFPGYKRLGGAPFNVAFHLKMLGFPICLASRVGADEQGKSILQRMQEIGLDRRLIQIDEKNRTGEVLVTVDENGEPDFSIAPDVAYDYIQYEPVHDFLHREPVSLIYFGSLAQRSEYGFATLQGLLLSRKPETKCLYDVNLRPRCYDKAPIVASLKHADVLKLNNEELSEIKLMLDGSGKSDEEFVDILMNRYRIEMVALTKGAGGSELYTSENRLPVKAPTSPKVVNSVGAGDAYASILAAGYLCRWQPEKIGETAAAFSARICEIDGAIPGSPSFYDGMEFECGRTLRE